MALTLHSKSEEVEGDNWDTMAFENKSKKRWQPQSRVRWIGAAAVLLGVVLLIILFSLVARNASGLIKCETLISNLTTNRDALRDEQDQLKMNFSRLVKDMELLQDKYNNVSASHYELQLKVQRLNHSMPGNSCRSGWIGFNNKCYYFSGNGKRKNWADSRKDCQERGGDLVVITTREERDFVNRHSDRTWIGLSDLQQEGTWRWVDGSDVTQAYWHSGEPNNAGNEDCAEMPHASGEWNDALCSDRNPWTCED